MTSNLSILILTLNEEKNLPSCFESIKWCDDIVILDSNSRDNTLEIAKSSGARIFQRTFDNYANQRNYGLTQITYKHQWLLMLDADEIIPEELHEEMCQAVLNPENNDICLFRMRRKDFLFGKWIKYSSKYPIWFGRLMKIGHVHVERNINEEYHTIGKVSFLKGHLIHYPFNKGFHAWIEKHNRYSTMEASLKFDQRSSKINLKSFFSKDPVKRRKGMKALFHTLPCRPLLMLFTLYFIRGGIIEGRAGLTYCLLTSFYEYMIDCKVKELEIRSKGKRL